MVRLLRLAQRFHTDIVLPVHQHSVREFMHQKLLIDESVQAADIRVRLLNMNDSHPVSRVIASYRKGFQLTVDEDACDLRINLIQIVQEFMNP